MANVDAIVQEAIAALRAGRKNDAKQLLMKATDLDEHHEQAWLWLSGCVESPEEQQICLENVLAINPNNPKARKGLDALGGQVPQRPAAPPPAASPSTYGDPFAGSGFDSSPSSSAGSQDSAFDTGWDTFNTSEPESPITATSVDWNRTGPAAYGSGKDVQLPSSQEYESWIANMGLNGQSTSDPSSETNFDMPDTGTNRTPAFTDSTDMFADNFGDDLFSADSAGNNAGDLFGSADSFAFGDGPFQAPAPDFADNFAFDKSGSANAARSDDAAGSIFSGVPGGTKNRSFSNHDELNDLRSNILDDSDDEGAFSIPPAALSDSGEYVLSGSRALSSTLPMSDNLSFEDESPLSMSDEFVFGERPKPASAAAVYFKSIPEDIQVGRRPNIRLLLTIGILGLLNAVSLALLFLNLMRS